MPDAYLDSSALVKRYVQEPGTPAVDIIFDRASDGAIVIATSVWNLGEAFGVFDHRRRRRLLSEHEFRLAVQNLTSEVLGLMRNGAMQVYPVRTSLLTEAWAIVLTQHLYQADALQIVTCNDSKSRVLITSDELLRRASEGLGLKTLDPDGQEREIQDLFG
ncbi:MAG: type II toxin-antitoxin system VapC family toxin [Candidatus Bathyarchaeia archaeon]